MGKTIEIRDPIHGFIVLDEWERDIVNHWVFQRLRRIRQLGLTDMVYPGAMHTRFEHSLGVMHVATCMFDEIIGRKENKEALISEMRFDKQGLERDRRIIRIASLLHDIGHAPFSHAAEEVMPSVPGLSKKYKHEDYSSAAIIFLMKDVIEDHPNNANYHITVQEVAGFISGKTDFRRTLIWRDLLSGHLDADRADYLLRDSYHTGVAYGEYDLPRLLKTLRVASDPENESFRIAIDESGLHTAESLILARYMMFTQVYFHHTRRIYDYHLAQAVHSILLENESESEGVFPPPIDKEQTEKYFRWNDWRVLGIIQDGGGGKHGGLISKRNHFRRVWETPEVPKIADMNKIERITAGLHDVEHYHDSAEKSWYKKEDGDIPILLNPEKGPRKLNSLANCSNVVKCLKSVKQQRIYVPVEKLSQYVIKIK